MTQTNDHFNFQKQLFLEYIWLHDCTLTSGLPSLCILVIHLSDMISLMQLKSLCSVTLACQLSAPSLPLFAIHFTITLQNMPPQLTTAGGQGYTYYIFSTQIAMQNLLPLEPFTFLSTVEGEPKLSLFHYNSLHHKNDTKITEYFRSQKQASMIITSLHFPLNRHHTMLEIMFKLPQTTF